MVTLAILLHAQGCIQCELNLTRMHLRMCSYEETG